MKALRYVFTIFILGFAAINSSHACVVAPFQEWVTDEPLQKMISTCDLRSVEEVLEKLPVQFQKRYTLIYDTKGLGKTTPQFPRILLSGPFHYLTISIDTHPESPIFNVIETAFAYKTDHQVTLRKIDFDENNRKHLISPANPGECMKCHANSESKLFNHRAPKARFIWFDFPYWPGVQGGTLDLNSFSTTQPRDWSVVYGVPQENAAFEKYVKPRLGKNAGASNRLGYLSADLYDDEAKFSFRTALRPFWHFTNMSDRLQFGQVVEDFKQRQIELSRLKYFLFAVNACLAEKNPFPDAPYSKKSLKGTVITYSPKELTEWLDEFSSDEQQFRLANVALRKLLNVPPLTKKQYQKRRLLVWKHLTKNIQQKLNHAFWANALSYKLSLKKSFPDFSPSDFSTILPNALGISESDHQYLRYASHYGDSISHSHAAHYLLIWAALKSFDVNFEHWSIDRVPFSSYGGNRNLNMGIALIYETMFFNPSRENSTSMLTPDEIAKENAFVSKLSSDYKVHERYKPHFEHLQFPGVSDKAFYENLGHACETFLKPMSVKYTRF